MGDMLSFSEVDVHLPELADRVEHQHDRILVTLNGWPSFVLLSSDDLESSEGSLDVLEDGDLMGSFQRSLSDAAQGKRVHLRGYV